MFDLQTTDQTAIKQMIANARKKQPESRGDPFLNFKSRTQNGSWLLGKEKVKVNGERILIFAASLKKGYVAFAHRDKNDKKPAEFLDETSAPVFSDRVAESSDLQVPANAQISAQVVAKVYFKSRDLQVELKDSSASTVQAVDLLIDLILDRLESGEVEYINPLVEMGVGHYDHKRHGTIYTAQLNLIDWCNAAGETKPKLESRV